MTCVRKDKAWEIVVYKNQYYVELYGCAIRVYDKSFELVYQRDNPKDFYSQIIIVEDTLFAQGQCNPFIDVFELPQLKLKKRIKLQSEKINEIKFFCGIGYIVALVLSACLIKMCFL